MKKIYCSFCFQNLKIRYYIFFNTFLTKQYRTLTSLSTTGIITIRSFHIWGNYIAVRTSSNVQMRLIKQEFYFSFYSFFFCLSRQTMGIPREWIMCHTSYTFVELFSPLALDVCIHIQWVHLILWPSYTHELRVIRSHHENNLKTLWIDMIVVLRSSLGN